MMGENPPLPLVVATRNRSAGLNPCLRALAALEYPAERFEVVMADNG